MGGVIDLTALLAVMPGGPVASKTQYCHQVLVEGATPVGHGIDRLASPLASVIIGSTKS